MFMISFLWMWWSLSNSLIFPSLSHTHLSPSSLSSPSSSHHLSALIHLTYFLLLFLLSSYISNVTSAIVLCAGTVLLSQWWRGYLRWSPLILIWFYFRLFVWCPQQLLHIPSAVRAPLVLSRRDYLRTSIPVQVMPHLQVKQLSLSLLFPVSRCNSQSEADRIRRLSQA